MNKWGVFTVEDDVESTVKMIENKGLEVFESRALTALEKLTYGYLLSGPIWIVMFYGTEADYKSVVMDNELTTVF